MGIFSDLDANAHLTTPLKMLPASKFMVPNWSEGPISMNHQGGWHPPIDSKTPILSITIFGSADRKTHKNFYFCFILFSSKWEGHTLDKTWKQVKIEESQCIVLHHSFTCSKFSQLKSHIHFWKNNWLKLTRNETLNFVVDVSVY